jgi:Xaa-Pro dipeptidase
MEHTYASRFERLKQHMIDHSLELVMVTSPTNVYYLTGFHSDPYERFMALVIDLKNNLTTLYVPELDAELAQAQSGLQSIIPVSDMDNPYEMLRENIGDQVLSLGVEKQIMSLFQSERLAEIFPKAKFADIESFILSLRLHKSPEDIRIIRRAIELGEKVVQHGVENARPGMTEAELAAELEYQMKIMGAERPAFPALVLSGPRTALPHGMPGQRKMERGDFLIFDLGLFVDGYCSDITRTFILGDGTDEQKRIHETVLQANRKAIDAVKVGNPIGFVDRAAREHITSQGYGSYFTHRVGHGLGLDVHESPSIHSKNELLMQPGMVFTIEPGIYIPGVGGVRIEDNIYIAEDGTVEVLTNYPKELRLL